LKHGRQTTCSRSCSYQLRASELEKSQQYECPVCGELFFRSPSQAQRARHGRLACSNACGYQIRQRVVTQPYSIRAEYDRKAAAQKAVQTRRANAKPYPEAARQAAAARMTKLIAEGLVAPVSRFEKEAAEVYRRLGFEVLTQVPVRRPDGTFFCVYDIVLPARRIVVECHGTFWHGGRWTWETPSAAQVKNLGYEMRKHIVTRSLGLDLRVLHEKHFRQDPLGACLVCVR
jgi:G:T-mismatch repair DNA endonuclease (very short patch repair protein)